MIQLLRKIFNMSYQNEVWKLLPGMSDRFVSNLGRVKKIDSKGKDYFYSCVAIPGGYMQACVRGYYTTAVHRMVLDAFVGPCPDGYQCDHIDRDPSNNRLDNLRWIPQYVNNPNSKLNPTLVRHIRAVHELGYPTANLADMVKVTPQAIYNIINNKAWKNI